MEEKPINFSPPKKPRLDRDTYSDLNVDDMPSKILAAKCVNRGAFDMDLTRKIITKLDAFMFRNDERINEKSLLNTYMDRKLIKLENASGSIASNSCISSNILCRWNEIQENKCYRRIHWAVGNPILTCPATMHHIF